jgi:predicted amidohydrolase
MTNRDLANASGLARWIIANGYRQHMTRKMVLRLAQTDPAFPRPVPSAGSETVWSLSQARCYLDPAADPSLARQYLGTETYPDVVDGAEMARRVVENGYASTMTATMVLRLARTDPDFAETLTAGEENQEKLWSWTEVEPYWQARTHRPPGWVVWSTASELARRGHGTLGPDLVNATEMARRVVAGGYAASMSHQRILELVRTDSSFPTPWPTAGTERLWSWSRAERSYWQPRRPSPAHRRHLWVTERSADERRAPDAQPGAKPTLVVAVAQPRVLSPPHGADQVHRAVAAVHEAAGRGAELLVFPEGYPGPLRVGEDHDPAVPLAAAAAATGCAVCWSRVEAGVNGRFHLVVYVVDGDGRQLGRYARAHPATGDVHQTLSGTAITPGPALADLVEVAGVPVGLLVCSELWLPEVARVLAVRGAELLLAPAGGAFGPLRRNWQLIARARAIENQCYLALTQGLFGEEPGLAMVAGPEDDVAALAGEGVLVAHLDLQRSRWLRVTDDSMAEPRSFRSLPGLRRARRPDLYGELAAPAEGLYDYGRAAAGGTVLHGS